jgi:hypothetical protein
LERHPATRYVVGGAKKHEKEREGAKRMKREGGSKKNEERGRERSF